MTWVATQVQHPENHDHVRMKRVVDGIGKSFGQEPMIAKKLRVDACVKSQGVDIGEQRIKEVLIQTVSGGSALPSSSRPPVLPPPQPLLRSLSGLVGATQEIPPRRHPWTNPSKVLPLSGAFLRGTGARVGWLYS